MADIHIYPQRKSNIHDLKRTIADINKQDSLEFVIIAGDISHYSTSLELEMARELLSTLNKPYYIIPGNHDTWYCSKGGYAFKEVFGHDNFHFSHNGIHFIGNTSGSYHQRTIAHVPSESLNWLDSVVTSIPTREPIIYINHYPLTPSHIQNAYLVEEILVKGNPQIFLCGHGHRNRRYRNSLIKGAMGRNNHRRGSQTQGVPGYNIVNINSEKVWIETRNNYVTGRRWFSSPLYSWDVNPSRIEAEQREGRLDGLLSANSPLTEVWRYQDECDITAAPDWAFGNVYIATHGGKVKALDGATGGLIWEFSTGRRIFSSPAVDEQSKIVVFGSADHNIYGVDALDGTLKWKIETTQAVLGTPNIYRGVAYIGSSDNTLRAIEVATGRVVWSYDKLSGFVTSKPWVDESGVYIGDWGNMVYAFELESGNLKWQWDSREGKRPMPSRSPGATWPVKVADKLFVGIRFKRVYALNSETGKLEWSHYAGREAIGLSSDSTTVYSKGPQDTLYAFNPKAASAKGALKWSKNLKFGKGAPGSPITSAYGYTFVPNRLGYLYIIEDKKRNNFWKEKISLSAVNYVKPIENRKVAVTTTDGVVAIYRLE